MRYAGAFAVLVITGIAATGCGGRQDAPNRRQQRLGGVVEEARHGTLESRVDPADQNPSEHHEEQRGDQELDEDTAEYGDFHGIRVYPAARSPNSARPTRTSVAPSSTATW